MGAAIIPAREIVESIYTKSASEEEKTKRIGMLRESIRCHRKSLELENRARSLIGELTRITEGKRRDV